MKSSLVVIVLFGAIFIESGSASPLWKCQNCDDHITDPSPHIGFDGTPKSGEPLAADMVYPRFLFRRFEDAFPEEFLNLVHRRRQNSNRMIKLAYLRQY